jgi:hypothetical protein
MSVNLLEGTGDFWTVCTITWSGIAISRREAIPRNNPAASRKLVRSGWHQQDRSVEEARTAHP